MSSKLEMTKPLANGLQERTGDQLWADNLLSTSESVGITKKVEELLYFGDRVLVDVTCDSSGIKGLKMCEPQPVLQDVSALSPGWRSKS